jgi:urease accessory protein
MALAVRDSNDDVERDHDRRAVGRGRIVASVIGSVADSPVGMPPDRAPVSPGPVGMPPDRVLDPVGMPTTVLSTLRASAPLKLLTPSFPSAPKMAAVCLVTFGGGLVDGDRIDVDLLVERGATLLVFTQSSTKVFRGHAEQRISARVEDGGTLILLPDPVSAFAGAHYSQRIEIELASRGSCVVLDGFTSGRAAFGERWMMSALDLKTTISRDGRVIVGDALRLEEADFSGIQGFDAFMTLMAIGQGALPVVAGILSEPILPPRAEMDLVVAASALARARSDSAIMRVAASRPALALSAVRARLRNLPEIKAVDPFSSRY